MNRNPPLIEGEANIGPDQGELAHGQVEDAGAFIDQGPAEGDQGIDTPTIIPVIKSCKKTSIKSPLDQLP